MSSTVSNTQNNAWHIISTIIIEHLDCCQVFYRWCCHSYLRAYSFYLSLNSSKDKFPGEESRRWDTQCPLLCTVHTPLFPSQLMATPSPLTPDDPSLLLLTPCELSGSQDNVSNFLNKAASLHFHCHYLGPDNITLLLDYWTHLQI